jgi:hypothetical protein
MDLLTTEGGRLILLILAGVGVLLQWDAVVEAIREARKGGDDSSTKDEPSPPDGD